MSKALLKIAPLSFPWQPPDPFLFCAYHNDAYPEGNGSYGPKGSLAGRNIGSDFEGKDGWRMYHGESIPGFPPHPHRGFETITVVRRGWIDHADSLGAGARFGGGDVQWVTAGKGIVHSEMFPMLQEKSGNHLELFQIWLNLPKANKMVDPHFVMIWNKDIPRIDLKDEQGHNIQVTLVAGHYANTIPPSPPPNSWASMKDSDVAVWTIRLDADAIWTLPAASKGLNRILYFFAGKNLVAEDQTIAATSSMSLKSDEPLTIKNGPEVAEFLLLQGRPIDETVVQHGPFVMNTKQEIAQAFTDYQKTRFGGWPWDGDEPVHGNAELGRFAKYPDGKIEKPDQKE